jgi:spore germination protein PC
MNAWQQWTDYFQQMHRQLEEQSRRIVQLERAVFALQTEMSSWKEQKRIHIDKVEYKFDQLKVEKLDGTLNIGLTPSALEDAAINGGNLAANGAEMGLDMDVQHEDQKVQPDQALRADINKEMKKYVETEVPKQLERLQTRYGHQLDAWHQKIIVEDLMKQTEARAAYYLQQMTPGATVEQLSSIKDSVLFRTRNDIKAAVDSYFMKFNEQKGET